MEDLRVGNAQDFRILGSVVFCFRVLSASDLGYVNRFAAEAAHGFRLGDSAAERRQAAC